MKPYGCHSKPRESGYWAQSMQVGDKDCPPFVDYVLVVDVMSKECHYRTTTPDERCQGCTCP